MKRAIDSTMGVGTQKHLDRTRASFVESHNIHYAQVVSLKDPYRSGNIGIRISGIHEDSITEHPQDVIWAPMIMPFGGGENFGFFAMPPVGSDVLVTFLDGDLKNPVILGAWQSRKFISKVVESQNELASVLSTLPKVRAISDTYDTKSTGSMPLPTVAEVVPQVIQQKEVVKEATNTYKTNPTPDTLAVVQVETAKQEKINISAQTAVAKKVALPENVSVDVISGMYEYFSSLLQWTFMANTPKEAESQGKIAEAKHRIYARTLGHKAPNATEESWLAKKATEKLQGIEELLALGFNKIDAEAWVANPESIYDLLRRKGS